MNPIGEGDQIGERRIDRGKLAALTINPLPGLSGVAGLIVATSNSGVASAAIGFSGGGGSGIAQAFSAVARFRFKAIGLGPW